MCRICLRMFTTVVGAVQGQFRRKLKSLQFAATRGNLIELGEATSRPEWGFRFSFVTFSQGVALGYRITGLWPGIASRLAIGPELHHDLPQRGKM